MASPSSLQCSALPPRVPQPSQKHHEDVQLRNEEEVVIEEEEEAMEVALPPSTTIRLDGACELQIYNRQTLSPLDMMDLYHGHADSTGQRLWMGAYFLLHYFLCCLGQDGPAEDPPWRNLFDAQPPNKDDKFRILEMGCGTGVVGVALLVLLQRQTKRASGGRRRRQQQQQQQQQQHHLDFTDANLQSLELCRHNCRVNHVGREIEISKRTTPCGKQPKQEAATTTYGVFPLDWNENGPFDTRRILYHVVVASDVLYDIALLNPLLSTASRYLRPHGFFVLSHVPRAFLPSDNHEKDSGGTFVSTAQQLEPYIIAQAALFSLKWEPPILRPSHLHQQRQHAPAFNTTDNDEPTLRDMEDVGAAILVFRKVPKEEETVEQHEADRLGEES